MAPSRRREIKLHLERITYRFRLRKALSFRNSSVAVSEAVSLKSTRPSGSSDPALSHERKRQLRNCCRSTPSSCLAASVGRRDRVRDPVSKSLGSARLAANWTMSLTRRLLICHVQGNNGGVHTRLSNLRTKGNQALTWETQFTGTGRISRTYPAPVSSMAIEHYSTRSALTTLHRNRIIQCFFLPIGFSRTHAHYWHKLLAAQSNHGIDFCGAPGRQPAGQRYHEDYYTGNGHQDERVVVAQPVNEAGRNLAKDKCSDHA